MVQLGKITRLGAGSRRRDLIRIFWTACVIIFVISMIRYPQVVFQGAQTGLKTWWNIVFPALLPFFIASELLMNFGVVHFMGVLLEPVMRPLFNVPGAGSFVMAIGYTSGYPIGSMVTARLRSEGLCSRVEAERLMSFTNNSSPLFMLVAVAVGMFNNPRIGLVIAGAHYLSNLVLGFFLRYYARNETVKHPNRVTRRLLVGAAIRRMLQVQREENRPVGKIMGDAVRNAVTNLLNIGGFIILFAVIIQLLFHVGFIDTLAGVLGVFLLPLGFSPEILPALGSGLFEMTIGSKLASEAAAPLLQQVVAIGMILAWSGLSVHAQAASMIAETDIRMLPFVVSRLAHTCLAGIFTCLFCCWMLPLEDLVTPALAVPGNWQVAGFAGSFKLLGFFLVALIALCLFSVFLNMVSNISGSSFFKKRF